MKRHIEDFALLDGRPSFEEPQHVAQLNLPTWPRVEAAFRGIFDRRYFTNNGPLVCELDQKFAEFLGVNYAVSVTNGTVALMILAKSLDLTGEVIVPAFTFPATVQALSWAGLTPVFCDVDPHSHLIRVEDAEPLITSKTSGILGVHVWGQPCYPMELQELADRKGLTLFFDACHSVGCSLNGKLIGHFGSGEAFSFHATKVLNGVEGGSITTNDDQIGKRLRTIRGFYGKESCVPLRINGKMSEAQAAMALLSLEDLPANIAANKKKHERFESGLKRIPGIRLLEYDQANANNYQYIVIEIEPDKFGMTCDQLNMILKHENVITRRHFFPGVHRMQPYSQQTHAALPNTENLCERVMQLPLSATMQEQHIETLCQLIAETSAQAPELVEFMNKREAGA